MWSSGGSLKVSVSNLWSNGRVTLNRLLLVTLCLLQLARGDIVMYSGVSNYSFPDDFMFGVATSAFQIEGGWNEGGKGESIMDTFLHNNPTYTADHKNGDVADDSYHLWREDIELIKSLDVDGYRMSISWPRILPNGTDNNINEEGVKYYRNIFEELLKANITPVVTLYHWDMPTSLMELGGWTNPKLVDYFEDYVRVVFKLYGDIVKMWITLNEIHEHCHSGILDGVGVYLCMHHGLLAHARAYRLYEKEFKPHQQGKVAIVLCAPWAEPKDSNKPEDIKAAEDYMQMRVGTLSSEKFYNDIIILLPFYNDNRHYFYCVLPFRGVGILAHPIYSDVGDYPSFVRERVDNMSRQQGYSRSRLPHFTPEEVKALQGSADFFGLNHYSSCLASPSSMEPSWEVPSLKHDTGVKVEQDPSWPKPSVGWVEAYPPGFRKIINWFHSTYKIFEKIPIIVTENGLTDKGQTEDYERVSYINEYLYQLLLAIHEDGVNVKGYFHWSLMDNMEWADGYTVKFGLFKVDYNSPNRTRTPKLSAKSYANIVRTRRIDFDYIKPPSVHNTVSSLGALETPHE